MIVKETNRYARQCIARKPDPKWKDTSREEMQAFFSLHVLFGYHNLPETSLYWSNDETLGVAFMKRVIPRDRFNKLKQYLHLNNNENAIPQGQPNHDKLFKVWPFLEAVVKAISTSPESRCRWSNGCFQRTIEHEAIRSIEANKKGD